MNRVAVFAIIASLMAGCADRTSNSRFPDFREFIEISSVSLDDEAEFEESIEDLSRLSFNSDELNSLFASSEVESLLVVYMQSHYDDPLRVASLEKAIITEPNNRLVAMQQVAHCSYANARTLYDYCGRDAFEVLINLDPENMMSYYLAAGYWGEKNNLDMALSFLRKGNGKNNYDIYEEEYFRILTERAQGFGHPRYVADANAFGSFSTTMHTKLLFELCKIPKSTAMQKDIRDECIVMGEKIEEYSKTILGKAMGIGIQVRTLEAMGNMDSQVKLIEQRRDSLMSASGMLEDIPNDLYTEKMWANFYEELFQVGETEAFKNLANRARGAGDL